MESLRQSAITPLKSLTTLNSNLNTIYTNLLLDYQDCILLRNLPPTDFFSTSTWVAIWLILRRMNYGAAEECYLTKLRTAITSDLPCLVAGKVVDNVVIVQEQAHGLPHDAKKEPKYHISNLSTFKSMLMTYSRRRTMILNMQYIK